MCTKSHNYMMYRSSDTERDTEFFVILGDFLPFYHPTPITPNDPKNQNLKKIKKAPGDIIILHRCNINDSQIMYGS